MKYSKKTRFVGLYLRLEIYLNLLMEISKDLHLKKQIDHNVHYLQIENSYLKSLVSY